MINYHNFTVIEWVSSVNNCYDINNVLDTREPLLNKVNHAKRPWNYTLHFLSEQMLRQRTLRFAVVSSMVS